MLRWTAGSRVALCKECDDLEKWKENDEKENAADVGIHENGDCQRQEVSFVFDCASRGFHEYRRVWALRMGHRLSVFFEKSNVFDLYAMALEKPKLLSQKVKLLVICLERFLDFANSFATMEENFQLL